MDLRVINSPKGRKYVTPNGDQYPSITTILGAGEKPWLNDWRASLGPIKADIEQKRCADRGSAVHDMVEKFILNKPNPTANHDIAHVREFNSLKLILKKITGIVAQEIALYSDTLKIAGRVDCVGYWNGKLAIIDFKTSNNNKDQKMIQDYWLQTTAYALMIQEMYDIVIDDLVIIMSVEKGIVPLVFTGRVDDYIEPLVERINKFYSM